MRPKSIEDVAEGHLCCGCGACAYLEPETVTMVNIVDRGLRPQVLEGRKTSAETFAACPGAGLQHSFDRADPSVVEELADTWGPVHGLWEGYASDDSLRWAGSSAGAATVLAGHCLENENMSGVLHIGPRADVPYLNETIFSTTPQQLLAATGSRYAPASPCDGLQQIEDAARPSVFIGKPCDVAAAQMARKLRPRLDANLGLTIALFCAGTPSTAGTLEMLAYMGVDADRVSEVRYRGRGWPGSASATGPEGQVSTLSYEESWGAILQKHRQWRCYVCADHTGEFADIAVGDPWYHDDLKEDDPGRSLIVARTPKGIQTVQAAIDNGLLVAWTVDPQILVRSQPNLESTRGAVWGRLLVTRSMGVFAPRYENMPMFNTWLRHLTTREKISSIGGTFKRVFKKRLRHREKIPPGSTT